MLHVFEFFSNKSDSTLRNKNGAKLYTSLPPFSHLLFYSPRSFFIHFSLDIPHRILWRVLFFERILSESFSSSLNISKSNWKYSTRAPCFYIYLHFAIGFFRLWLSKPPPSPLSQDAFVCVRPPSEDLQKRFPPPQYLFFPRGSFQSFRIEEYVHLYHLYRGNPSFRLPLCVRDTAPIVRQFAATFSTNRCLHRYFPLTILPPSLLIIIL